MNDKQSLTNAVICHKHVTRFGIGSRVWHVMEPDTEGLVMNIQLGKGETCYQVQWSSCSAVWNYESELKLIGVKK